VSRGFKMPDWKQIVGKNLGALGICSPEFTQELAAHLEDSYETLVCEGLPPEVAFQHTIGQIDGRRGVWLVMRLLQEELMTNFIRQAALPGLLTSAAAWFFHWALTLGHSRPEILWLVGGPLPLWWWCLLPVCGALGALLSQRNGGSQLQRIAASQLPSAILCTLALLIFVAGFTISGFVNHYQSVSVRLESLGLAPPGFGLIPAAFSLLGAGIAEIGGKKLRRAA
jgi:hypothetical protein